MRRLCFLLAVAAGISTVRAADSGEKQVNALQGKIGELSSQIDMASHANDYLDPAHRDSIKDQVLPLLQQRRDAYKQLVALEPGYTIVHSQELEIDVSLAVYGDQEATDEINTFAGSKDSGEKTAGKLGQLWVQWINSPNDEDAQNKLLDQFEAVSKKDSHNSEIAAVMEKVLNTNAATAAVQSRGSDIIAASPSAEAKLIAKLPEQLGKPMTVQGDSLTGPYDSTSLKGKVILVDCWATWCENCIAFLPHLKEVYQKYHHKGLTIVALDSDQKKATLQKFLAKNAYMDWPQLFGGGELIHPLAKSYGVAALPYAFMIDKNGILRSTMAREQMDELVPKLLAEKP